MPPCAALRLQNASNLIVAGARFDSSGNSAHQFRRSSIVKVDYRR